MKSVTQLARSIARFLVEVKAEFAKIEWPKIDEFYGSTLVVIAVVIIFAIFLGSVDRVITWIARQIFSYSG